MTGTFESKLLTWSLRRAPPAAPTPKPPRPAAIVASQLVWLTTFVLVVVFFLTLFFADDFLTGDFFAARLRFRFSAAFCCGLPKYFICFGLSFRFVLVAIVC